MLIFQCNGKENPMKRLIAVIILTSAFPFIEAYADSSDIWSSSYALEVNGKYEQAAALLVPELAGGEESEFALLRYGWLNYLQGNFNDSIKTYKRAMEHNPRSFDARLGIVLPLMAQKRWKESIRYLKQVLAQSPIHYTSQIRLMACEEGLKQWQTLAQHAASFSAYYPSDATPLVYLARAYAWQGKKTQAAAAYRRVLVRYPGHLEATRYLKR